jgi:hypothetical protein
MTNDMYINRIVQKSDNDNKNKFDNFVERNNDLSNRKKLRLNEKIQKINEDMNKDLYFIPNKKQFNKGELRNYEKFFEDQKNFLIQKKQNIEQQILDNEKKEIIKSNNYIPEIDKKSKNIANKNNRKDVFNRLHNQINIKNKNKIFEIDDLITNEKDKEKDKQIEVKNKSNNKSKINNNINNNNNSSKANKKLNKEKSNKNILENNLNKNNHLSIHSNKLHADAKNWLIRNNERTKNIYKENDNDIQCRNTKLINIKKFINDFDEAIKINFLNEANDINLYELNGSINLNYNEYKILLIKMGFLNDEKEFYEKLTDEENNKIINERQDKRNKLKEKLLQKDIKLMNDSWNILTLNSNSDREIDLDKEKEKENNLSNSNDILVFLCFIQGFLKGDSYKINNQEKNDCKDLLRNSLYYKSINSNSFNIKDNTNLDKKNQRKIKSLDKFKNKTLNLGKLSKNTYNYNNNNLRSLSNKPKIMNNKEYLFNDKKNILSENYLSKNSPFYENNNKNQEFNKFKRVKSNLNKNMLINRKSNEGKLKIKNIY